MYQKLWKMVHSWQRYSNNKRVTFSGAQWSRSAWAQARREPQRGPGNIIAGHYHPLPILYVLRSRRRRRREGGNMGRGVPSSYRLGVRGSVVSSPSASGAEPRPKMDFMHILGQKEATWNTKRRGARENFPPFPRLSTGLHESDCDGYHLCD